MSIGSNIRQFREERNLTQEQVGDKLGISFQAVSSWERDEYKPDVDKLIKLAEIFDSSDPIQDQLKLWDVIVFNYLIGNTDAHIKNSSLLYSSDMRSLRLAPAYDLVSTTVYEQSTREMAFYIGEEMLIDKITRDSFRSAAKEAGISERIAMQRFDDMKERFVPSLKESNEQLCDTGYPRSASLMEKILKTGGVNI